MTNCVIKTPQMPSAALEAAPWELLLIFRSQELHLLTPDTCVMCHKYPCHREVWAFPSERLQPCLMPRMGSVPLGIPETETWDPEKEISASQTVSLLCFKQPSSSWLSWSHQVTQHHHPTTQAAGGSRQSQLYLPSFPQRRRPLANDKKTHVYLDVLNQLKSLLIFASKHEANRGGGRGEDLTFYCNDIIRCIIGSKYPATGGKKKLLWFGVLVCSFFSLFTNQKLKFWQGE